jgi:hypothetical protein
LGIQDSLYRSAVTPAELGASPNSPAWSAIITSV